MPFILSADRYDRDDLPLCDRNSVIPQTVQSTRMDYKKCKLLDPEMFTIYAIQAMLLIVILFTNMTTLCKTQTPFNIFTSPILNLSAPELFFFLILAHPLYKM